MIDAHLHLQDPRFDKDRERLLQQAKENGVTGFFCASACPEDWENLLSLAKNHPAIRPFIGTHPWHSSRHREERLGQMLIQTPFAGIGEIGLDSLKGENDQENVFAGQLKLGAELDRPCVIHCVKSFDKTAEILNSLKKYPPSLLFHGFSGTVEQARFLLRFNAYFSFSGAVLSDRQAKNQAVFKTLPEDRVLIETDAPDMIPPAKFCLNAEEKRNIPANLPTVIKGFARLRNTDEKKLSELLDKNAGRFLQPL